MEVYWLEQSEGDLPTTDDWLSPNEVVRLSTMRIAKRRSDWRLGRWTAKNALALYLLSLKIPADPQVLTAIEIRPATSGAPEAFFQNKEVAASISLSHRAGIAACAVAGSSGVLGCDLETVEPRSDAFVADYFTTARAIVRCGSACSRSPAALGLTLERERKCAQSITRGFAAGPEEYNREPRRRVVRF